MSIFINYILLREGNATYGNNFNISEIKNIYDEKYITLTLSYSL